MYRLLGTILLAVSVVGVAGLFWLVGLFFFPDDQSRSNFGAYFGALTAIFSGLAFIFLLLNLWVQRDHLDEIRQAASNSETTAEINRWLQLASVLTAHYRREIAALSNSTLTGPAGAANSRRIEKLEEMLKQLEDLMETKHHSVVIMLERL